MAKSTAPGSRSLTGLYHYFREILGPEKQFYVLAVIYGVGISLLSVATPVSVQMLINNVANSGLATPLIVLSLSLFGLLLVAGMLNAMRIHLMDIFGRRFYARMVAEIALRSLYARNPHFEDNNQGALFNRYFDSIVIMMRVPDILVSGFTIILQAVAGIVLVSSYHPMLLIFNLIIVALVWLIWVIWGKRAMRSAVELSHRKHATAAWLEAIGKSNGFYKSEQHIDAALSKTDDITGNYLEQHRKHFWDHFSQTLSFLVIYAAASASLLGLGGWLVIQGELSLGQLVAAELVMSVVFFGISQLGIYLSYFYDVCGAIDELSLFFQVEQEQPKTSLLRLTGDDTALEFVQVQGERKGTSLVLNCTIPAGARVCAYSDSHSAQRIFTDLLKCHVTPTGGYIAVGGVDLRSLKAYEVRQEIIVLDRPNAVESGIREYLRLSADDDQAIDLMTALRVVGLEQTLTQLSDGLDTRLVSTGWPLSITETMQLKLAAAIIARPRVLVLSQVYDALPERNLLAALELLQTSANSTVIYFTNKHTDFHFDRFLYLNHDRQQLFTDYAELCSVMDFCASELREPLEGHGMEPAGAAPVTGGEA